MMAFWARTTGYKVGVILLFLSTIVFVIGFGAPFWRLREYSLVNASGALTSRYYRDGPFMTCMSGDDVSSHCSTLDTNDITVAWLHAVRTLECLCLIGLVASCFYATVVNCCTTWPGSLLRLLEVVAGFSGLLGFIGVIVYVGSSNKSPQSSTAQSIAATTPPVSVEFDWALYLAAIGGGLSVIAAIIITLFNVDHADENVKNTINPLAQAATGVVDSNFGSVHTGIKPLSQGSHSAEPEWGQHFAGSPSRRNYPLAKEGLSSFSLLDDRPYSLRKGAGSSTYAGDRPYSLVKAAHSSTYLNDRPYSLAKEGFSSFSPLDDRPYVLSKGPYSSTYLDDRPSLIHKGAYSYSGLDDSCPYPMIRSGTNPFVPHVYPAKLRSTFVYSYSRAYPHFHHYRPNYDLVDGDGNPIAF